MESTSKRETCKTCGQFNIGQTGEYPCKDCGLPQVWDDVPERMTGEEWAMSQAVQFVPPNT